MCEKYALMESHQIATDFVTELLKIAKEKIQFW